MTYLEMKKKVLAMIEEINPNSEFLTDDPDIAEKFREVTNQILFELARIKKIPKYVVMPVTEGARITFADIERKCGNEVFQLGLVCGVDHTYKAGGTVIKILEDGEAEIDCFVYPERITEKTKEKAYEFEISADALEIMPYGVAADLLKSDPSADYGQVYRQRYLEMIQRLDPRYALPGIRLEGGYDL